MTGSAFAARALITGADIKDGSVTRADLSGRTLKSLKGRRGPAGRNGFIGARGPQGDTGPAGPAGPAGPTGPTGPRGGVGDTGLQGPIGRTGPIGPTGDQGPPGQTIAGQFSTGTTPLDTTGTDGTLALGGSGPSTTTDSVDLVATAGGFVFLGPGQYIVHTTVSFTDGAADSGLEYGVARLFLNDSPLDGTTSDPGGGSSNGDTLLETADVPDDGTNAAQASGSFLITVDGGGGGEVLSLRAAVRTAEAEGASATAQMVVTHVG